MKYSALMVALVATGAVSAAPQGPPAGRPVVPAEDAGVFKLLGAPDVATLETVDVAGRPFAKAYRVHILKRPELYYHVSLRVPTSDAVEKGDVLLLSCQMRAVETHNEEDAAYAFCVVERAKQPYNKSLAQRVGVGREWKEINLPFVSDGAYAAGEAQVCFQLGYDRQALEIGGIRLTNYRKSVRLQDLPRTRFSYPGREENAAWRKAALERIERIRKGDLKVVVTDAAGRPVRGATVAVRMKRHAYAFGTAVAAQALLATTPDAEKYRDTVKQCFNRVVMENDLKWPSWEGNRRRAIDGVKWLRDQGIEVRGHNLIWPSWRYTPKDLQALKDQPDALRKRIADHIADEAGTIKGQLVEWDVINEPFSNKDVMGVLGDDAMADWFRLARQADPDARLFLNDYPILGPGNAHLDHFEKTLRFLQEKGAPLGGIGVQCHYGASPAPPKDLLAGLDRLAKLGLPVEATEFDVETADEELQADYMRDHLIAFFSHPATIGVVMWGFWEGLHWKPSAALWRKDWSLKPNGQVWMDLVHNQWWTHADGKTDRAGVYATRGFLGDYEITVTAGGKSQSVPARLGREGASVAVELK